MVKMDPFSRSQLPKVPAEGRNQSCALTDEEGNMDVFQQTMNYAYKKHKLTARWCFKNIFLILKK